MYDIFSLPDIKFPENFLWGSGTAGHQIEGNNIYSGHWEYEQKNISPDDPYREPSGMACNHYEMVKEDVNLIADLGHPAYRMSIEWCRIEPEEGKFCEDAVNHYINELELLRSKGIKVFITLIHFSVPAWFEKMGGIANTDLLPYFERYLHYILPKIAKYAEAWNVLNEFNLGLSESETIKKRSALKFHARGYHIIKQYSSAPVSSAHAFVQYTPKRPYDEFDKTLASYMDWSANGFFMHAIRTGEILLPFTEGEYCEEVKDSIDFWSINMYTRTLADARVANGLGERYKHKELKMIPMEFYMEEMYPENFIAMLTRITDKPIYITENGCSCDDDRFRIVYMSLVFSAVYEAMQMGADVRGYLHWSTFDNYEWGSYIPRFGLVDVDRKTFKRTPKPSAYFYKEIIENNGFSQEILRKYLKEMPSLSKKEL